MKVYANAFQLTATGSLSVREVFSILATEGIQEFKHSSRDRVFSVEQKSSRFLGCILSMRTEDSYLSLEKDERGSYFAMPRQTEGGPTVDFTFFIVSKKTGNGIFTQYQGSGGLTQFTNMLRNRHKVALDAARDIQIEEAVDQNGEISEAERKQISKQFSGTFTAVPLTTNPNFAKELKRLTSLSRFEYVSPTVDQKWLRSVKDEVRYVRHSVSFDSRTVRDWSAIATAIKTLVVDDGVVEGTVHGRNTSGLEDKVTIHPEVFCMADYEYKSVVTGAIRLTGFAEQEFFRTLIALSNHHPELF